VRRFVAKGTVWQIFGKKISNSKFIFFLSIMLSAATNKDNTPETYGIEILFKHRLYISDIYHPCKYGVGLWLRDCGSVAELLDTFENKSFNEWDKNADILWKDFFTLCRLNKRTIMEKLPGVVPNDTILTEILSKALAYRNSLKVQQAAFGVLNDATPYKLIKKYSIQIKSSLDSSKLAKTDKNILLSYCDLTPALQKGILEDSTLPVTARIRLGDKKAERELINKFDAEQDFERKTEIVKQLAHAGTPECLKFLIERFNDPIYLYGKGGCIVFSIKFAIIEGFQRHLPEDTLFNRAYVDMCSYGSSDLNLRDSVLLDYANNVIQSFKKHYNVTPIRAIVNPAFKGPYGCTNMHYF
jgi:hypothetical protein